MSVISLVWPDSIFTLGHYHFQYKRPAQKGSGRIYRVYSVLTLSNVLIIRLTCALKRWFFVLRDEMEFDEVVR